MDCFNNKLVFTVEEMAEALGISRPVAYELVKRDGFPAIRVSDRRIIIPIEALKNCLNTAAGRYTQ